MHLFILYDIIDKNIVRYIGQKQNICKKYYLNYKIKTAVISSAVTACFLICAFLLIINYMAKIKNTSVNNDHQASDYYVFVIPGEVQFHNADCPLIMDNNSFTNIKLSQALVLRYEPCPLCHKKTAD